ncbi:MAG: MATE family efflux transporter [Eubacterium sp.]|nr:MATE family efflux transporter [Eubacterium sp.]
MVTFVITSLAMGSTVTIGHHVGEQKTEKAGNAVGTTILMFTALAIILTVLLEIFLHFYWETDIDFHISVFTYITINIKYWSVVKLISGF